MPDKFVNIGGHKVTVQNIFPTDHNVTNCLTAIPQDINLTLSSGTLTLKAGSKVYYPDGLTGTTPKFSSVTITEDKTASYSGTATGQFMLSYDLSSSSLFLRWINGQVESGTTTPTSGYRLYYNTADNKIYNVNNTTGVQATFPVCIGTVVSAAITSIDQVFNGMGYIGSTLFVLPGVKGLGPNGRNTDGSLKNREYSVTSVLTISVSDTNAMGKEMLLIYNGLYAANKSSYYYDETVNYFISTGSGGYSAHAVLASYTTSSGVVSNFIPRTVYHGMDFNSTPDVINVAVDTTINPKGITGICMYANSITVTLGPPPCIGYKINVQGSSGGSYVKFKAFDTTDRTVFLGAYQTMEFIGITGYQWQPVSGSTFTVRSPFAGAAGSNDWRTFWGIGTYHYIYESPTAAATYDLPHSYVSVDVVWEIQTRATATAKIWNALSVPSIVWVRKMHDSWDTNGWFQESPAMNVTVDSSVVPTNEYIGNKVVYCKAVSFTLSSSGSVTKAHGISTTTYGNYFTIVRIEGYISNSSPMFYPINYHDSGSYIAASADRTNISVNTNLSSLYSRNGVAFIYFTKP